MISRNLDNRTSKRFESQGSDLSSHNQIMVKFEMGLGGLMSNTILNKKQRKLTEDAQIRKTNLITDIGTPKTNKNESSSDSDHEKGAPLSPNLPKAEIVIDESDVDLNKVRYVLASIRRERVESWYGPESQNYLQSQAQGEA